jgi:hypothetical protein
MLRIQSKINNKSSTLLLTIIMATIRKKFKNVDLLPSALRRHVDRIEVQLHPFLTSVLDGGKWSTPHSGQFNPKIYPGTPLNS